MKISCACGETIVDQSDHLPHKAHIIGDRNYFDFLDVVDAAIEDRDANRAEMVMAVRRAAPSRLAWECLACGRLYLNDARNALVEYVPQNGRVNRIFDRPRGTTTG